VSDAFSSGTRPNGGSSSADGLMIGLLGLVAALAGRGARRRRAAA
jgi:MYXO-CTERM domain-containing protein